MLRVAAFTACLLASAAPAWAGETPLYQPVPAWVKEAPAPVADKLPTPRPQVLIFDQQQRIEDGRLSTYLRSANVIANPAMLNQAGTIRVDWQPDHGDVVIHHVRLLRGAETIDVLAKGDRFNVLKRELGMEQRMLTGILTAALEVEGAQVGDILDVAFTVTSRDPVLKGNVDGLMPVMTKPVTAGLARNRISWRKDADVRLRGYLDGLALEPVTVGDYREVELIGPAAKPVEMPMDAPLRFRPLPLVEASSFADWQAVSKTFAPLYATEGLIAPGSLLAAEVARIRSAAKTPRERAALALQSVQTEIRYLFKGMAGGNYTPQAPARTWEARYGDCKAKTLLLLAMLQALEVEAEPVLASIEAGDYVPKRLPGSAAFDHVLVHATIDGKDLWLDGTGQGARLADLDDTPPFRWGLPLRTAGAELMPIVMRANARPDAVLAVEIDERAGLRLPAPFKLRMTLRGANAEMMRMAQTAGNAEQMKAMAQGIAGNIVSGVRVVTHKLDFDAAENTGTIEVEGIAQSDWSFANGRNRRGLELALAKATFAPDRSRTAWKTIPVATGNPETNVATLRVILPDGGKGYTLEGAETLPTALAGASAARKVTLANGIVTVEDRTASSGAEIAPERVSAERAAFAAIKARPLNVVAPVDVARDAVIRRDAMRSGRLKPIMAMYDKAVAEAEPDDPSALDDRSNLRWRLADFKGALADLDKAIAIEASAERLSRRHSLLYNLRRDGEIVDAAKAAFEADSSVTYANYYAGALTYTGRYDEALEVLEPFIVGGGQDMRAALAERAEVLERKGDAEEAVAAIDRAIADKPNDPDLLNSRCWLRGTMNVELDAALADCDRAIALGISTAAALDSRALVHFRAGRLDQARADLDQALSLAPEMNAALYLRGIVRKRQGDAAGSAADIEAATFDSPRLADDYKRWGVTG
ncbi:DUF3857 domain-containing protein [Sphingomonas sp. Y38-1Y]|uniref:DUF3857 domain-containing protein n=1 Tax=Sphingomonas sp. Y38-1Y TaxID=3078265 RepID=UPI0028E314F0|nr:DUF3857 domain-containing protein [Sphingomonas sp. Y38-1Y]